jgi:hypothetical protein
MTSVAIAATSSVESCAIALGESVNILAFAAAAAEIET